MAVIPSLPDLSIISGFKGVIDYYVHQGTACVRKWPRHGRRLRSPQELATTIIFTEATKLYVYLSPQVIADYQEMASGTPMTSRDLFMRSYISGIFQPPPHT